MPKNYESEIYKESMEEAALLSYEHSFVKVKDAIRNNDPAGAREAAVEHFRAALKLFKKENYA